MEWRQISGYEGYYNISNCGCVRSLDRTLKNKNGTLFTLRGKNMKITKQKGRNNDGYSVVNLRRDGMSYVALVHILVAKAFLDNPYHLPTVNHKDGNKNNNHVENLEWVSFSDNNIHALKNNLRKPRGNPIVQKDIDGKILGVFKSESEASRMTRVGLGSISHCINGRSKTSGGYIWENRKV